MGWALTPKLVQGESSIRFAEPFLGIKPLQLLADGCTQHPAPHIPKAAEARVDVIEIVALWVGKATGTTQRVPIGFFLAVKDRVFIERALVEAFADISAPSAACGSTRRTTPPALPEWTDRGNSGARGERRRARTPAACSCPFRERLGRNLASPPLAAGPAECLLGS